MATLTTLKSISELETKHPSICRELMGYEIIRESLNSLKLDSIALESIPMGYQESKINRLSVRLVGFEVIDGQKLVGCLYEVEVGEDQFNKLLDEADLLIYELDNGCGYEKIVSRSTLNAIKTEIASSFEPEELLAFATFDDFFAQVNAKREYESELYEIAFNQMRG